MRRKFLVTILLLLVYLISGAQEAVIYSNMKVGDVLPDLELKGVDNFHKSNFKLSELDQELLIIDFWATWCGPCVAMIPRMDSIMKTMSDQMLFLSVTNEAKAKAYPLLLEKEKELSTKLAMPHIYADTTLSKLFPHFFLPHYVWIKLPERKVIAITKGSEIRYENIQRIVSNSKAANTLANKVDEVLDYKNTEPLLPYLIQFDSLRNNSFKQYSFFTDYVPNLHAGMYETISTDTSETIRVVAKNVPIKTLAAWAFGEAKKFIQDSSFAIEVREPEKVFTDLSGTEFRKWREKNTYCYELKTSKFNKSKVFEIIQQDIADFFSQYEFIIEQRQRQCMVLLSTGNNESLKSKQGNRSVAKRNNIFQMTNQSSFEVFLAHLRYFYFRNSPILFADRTNIDFYIDFSIEPSSYREFEALNSELKKYNLKFEKRMEYVDVLVIRDKEKT